MLKKKFLIFLMVLNAIVLKAQIKLADSLFATGDYAEAIAVYKNSASDDAKLQAKIANAYQAIGNYNLALDYYEKAVKQDSSLRITVNRYAKLLRQTEKYQEADSILSKLIKRFPENPEFHYQRGMVWEKRKDTLAISSFQQAIH